MMKRWVCSSSSSSSSSSSPLLVLWRRRRPSAPGFQRSPLQGILSSLPSVGNGGRSHATSADGGGDIFSKAFEDVKRIEEREKEEGQGARPKEVRVLKENLPISMKRIDHLLRQIRNLNYREAVLQLKFCQKRIAPRIIEALEKARLRAEVKHGLDPDRLVIKEIYATKGQYGPPKIEYKAKSRIGIRRRKKSHLTVKLKEIPYQEGEKQLGKFARGVNTEKRKEWQIKLRKVAREMGVSPLVVTTKQVELWDLYKEKILGLPSKSASPPKATPAGHTATV
jgi:large subunit ribosomal protein L22